MGNQIVFPGKVIETFAHEPSIGAEIIFFVFAFSSGRHGKRLRLIRRKVSLENYYVGQVIVVKVCVYGLAK